MCSVLKNMLKKKEKEKEDANALRNWSYIIEYLYKSHMRIFIILQLKPLLSELH